MSDNNNTVQYVVNGDSAKELKKIPDNTVGLVVSDPPYGYSFMGKDWDKAVPSIDIWKECFRVLKPGAFMFIMSAPRQDVLSQMIVRLAAAGFETDFTSIYWTYASGFPKAADISKLVDKKLGVERPVVGSTGYTGKDFADPALVAQGSMMQSQHTEERKEIMVTAPGSEQAKKLQGAYAGFQPKPAVEIIIVVMKPLSEKSYVEQAMANGKGVTWLHDCRIPYRNDEEKWEPHDDPSGGQTSYIIPGQRNGANDGGRFPANLLVSDDVLNDGKVTKSNIIKANPHESNRDGTALHLNTGENKWVDGLGGGYNDSGSFSRYFDLDIWAEKTLPFLLVPKPSTAEKDRGLESLENKMVMGGGGTNNYEAGRKFGSIKAPKKNTHPTVKPIKLLAYLITLGSRPGDLILDPFNGSGGTGIAAKMLGRNYVGVELQLEYVAISNMRLEAWKPDDLSKIVFKEEIKITKTERVNPAAIIAPPNPNAVGLEKWFS